jgi:hypothetical protein
MYRKTTVELNVKRMHVRNMRTTFKYIHITLNVRKLERNFILKLKV